MDLSIATARAKRSTAEKGYVNDTYVKYFVSPLEHHMDPTMHRGYHARMTVIDNIINEFDTAYDQGQIIVLGAGFDSGYWRRGISHGLYVECDRTSVITKKQSIIECTAELKKTANKENNFYLLACDLDDVDQLSKKILSTNINMNLPTLFIAEAALVYLAHENISKLFQWITTTFKHSALAHYDVIAANDRFGKQMLDSFTKRGWPLHGAAASIDAYKKRAVPPFSQVEAADMFRVYQACVLNTPEERKRIALLEIFDDPDEFKLLMQHSLFLIAANGSLINTLLAFFRQD